MFDILLLAFSRKPSFRGMSVTLSMKTLKSLKVAHYITLRNKKNRSLHNSFDQFNVTIHPQLTRSTVALELGEH